ncbi:Alpha/beta hydrolase family protein [Maioricimonas rarisocia]|uniref:Alpha/beta hydrolase family protein n=1 Tax=Maioricimonas rarisocia TaxID=2528026 RepID=A0A517Z1B9_9PLAN|nr:alpha/beta hydrolase-fold protein [Maioricimonas rarisocia]QDU36264.1 Alpha/beta hydrolase family protein [Maioricimonas rarisocia]
MNLVLRTGVAVLVLAVMTGVAKAAETGFIERTYEDAAGAHPFRVYVPKGYSPDREWPVMLFLHGAGERGTDGLLPITVGLGPMIEAWGEDFPFIVVFPQCEAKRGRILKGWNPDRPHAQRALKMLEQVEAEFATDPERRVLTGWSMGGFGCWRVAAATPDMWSAVVVLAGGGEPELASNLTDVPVWIFHGADDEVVPPGRSRELVAALEKAGCTFAYTELSGVGHNCWRQVYTCPDVVEWMLDPSQPPGGDVEPDQAILARAARARREKFREALRIPGAVAVRIGPDAMTAAGFGLSDAVPNEWKQGRIDDIEETLEALGEQFVIQMREIDYALELDRAIFRSDDFGRLQLRIGVRNLVLEVAQTSITGTTQQIRADGLRVVVGHRRPVWLEVDVHPVVRGDRMELRLLGADFRIPDDNWYVAAPRNIEVRGGELTPDLVRIGLVGGLYLRKSQIEAEVRRLVPDLIATAEDMVSEVDASPFMASVWPVPVYTPDARLRPQAVQVDSRGAELVFGLVAGPVDAVHVPERPRLEAVPVPALDSVDRSRFLQLDLAPGVVTPLSQMIVDADVARLHPLDVPDERFHVMADRAFLESVVPDLKTLPDDARLLPEFRLVEPLSVRPGQVDSNGTDMEFVVPGVVFSIDHRSDVSSPWQAVAELEISVSQQARLELVRGEDGGRTLRLGWSSDPQVEVHGRFADGYTPRHPELNVDAFRREFVEAWTAWTRGAAGNEVAVPNLQVGAAAMGLSDLKWSSNRLVTEFSMQPSEVANEARRTFEYKVRGPDSRWSQPYRLPGGESHEYRVPYDMELRAVAPLPGARSRVVPGGRLMLQPLRRRGRFRLRSVEPEPQRTRSDR